MISRRDFLKATTATGLGLVVSGVAAGKSTRGSRSVGALRAHAAAQAAWLSDPASQPKFVNAVPDAMAPGFIYSPDKRTGEYHISVAKAKQWTGLVEPGTGKTLKTSVWGYGDAKDQVITWPGRTFQVKSVSAGGPAETVVNWYNELKPVKEHLLPVDTSLHWAYALDGYTGYSIATDGVPIITHLHGGHTDFQFDGNPEFFYGPGGMNQVVGPQWANVPGGFTTKFRYDNNVSAGNLWYHDHALGITRLNVYAGMAGFYFVRDDVDTGEADNPLGLPAWPYEKAYAIQDRMFWNTGELFYPAYPGDPAYYDFITGEGVTLEPPEFPLNPRGIAGFNGGGPTALAEFFGDHIVVNGMIWPKENVEPRNYRMHVLNGTDSRFMALRFRSVPLLQTDLTNASAPLPFYVIGSDQGLAASATQTDMLLSEPGSRYDIVFDFSQVPANTRVIMENIGGDEPFGGVIPGPVLFTETNRIMAFDVVLGFGDLSKKAADNFNPAAIGQYSWNTAQVDRVRKVALFEGLDEFGRLQPLLGTAEPATDYQDSPINWPAADPNTGQMQGSIAWHSPTTENPAEGTTEIWEIYNATGDAHPVHLHLVNFQVGTGDVPNYGVTRQEFTSDVIQQPVMQHNGTQGIGFRLENITLQGAVSQPAGYIENAPKDMVTALPGQVTRIKTTFDKPGRYVWHCHILSHEDHEMMRVLHVGPGA